MNTQCSQSDRSEKDRYQEYQIRKIEEFFSGDLNLPWQPLPEHSIEESPCYRIMETSEIEHTGRKYYRCKIHSNIWNFDFEEIEYHCKYEEPDTHRKQILRLLHSNDDTAYPSDKQERLDGRIK